MSRKILVSGTAMAFVLLFSVQGAMAVSEFWQDLCLGSYFEDVNGQAMPVATCGAIEEMARMGVTAGCSDAPAQYCPETPVTRAQFATLLVKMMSYYYDEDAIAKRILGILALIESLERRIAELETRR